MAITSSLYASGTCDGELFPMKTLYAQSVALVESTLGFILAVVNIDDSWTGGGATAFVSASFGIATDLGTSAFGTSGSFLVSGVVGVATDLGISAFGASGSFLASGVVGIFATSRSLSARYSSTDLFICLLVSRLILPRSVFLSNFLPNTSKTFTFLFLADSSNIASPTPIACAKLKLAGVGVIPDTLSASAFCLVKTSYNLS